MGVLFHDKIDRVGWIVPYLIFSMLLLTFCKVEPRELRFQRSMIILVAIQILGGIAVYFALIPFSKHVAQAVMICVLCPVATAAPVVTGLLGGNVGRVATFSVISNIGVAVVSPLLFAWVSPCAGGNFLSEFFEISARVVPMIVLPLLTAFALRYTLPKVHARLSTAAPAAFYIWSLSLIIVVGRSVSYVMKEPRSMWPQMIFMAVGAAVACVVLFVVGKRVGRAQDDSITTGQSLGQKNTVLAIWMAMTYLDGISSVGPAAYVLWQNGFNSWQLYRKMKSETAHGEAGNAAKLKSKNGCRT